MKRWGRNSQPNQFHYRREINSQNMANSWCVDETKTLSTVAQSFNKVLGMGVFAGIGGWDLKRWTRDEGQSFQGHFKHDIDLAPWRCRG